MRRFRRLLIVAGGLLLVLALFAVGSNAFIAWRESQLSTGPLFLKTPEGEVIPVPPPVVDFSLLPSPSAPKNELGSPEESRIEGYKGPFGPATRFAIPRLSLDVSATVGDNRTLPRAKEVAWYFGTAFPGAPGNSVMFGHVSGPYETLGRLKEVQEGDVIRVYSERWVWSYKVTDSRLVAPTDVTVMAPTPDSTLTVITCAGEQNLLTRQYSHRLVVVAKLVSSAPPGSED